MTSSKKHPEIFSVFETIFCDETQFLEPYSRCLGKRMGCTCTWPLLPAVGWSRKCHGSKVGKCFLSMLQQLMWICWNSVLLLYLVGGFKQPPWKIWVRQSGSSSQLLGTSQNSCSSHHTPAPQRLGRGIGLGGTASSYAKMWHSHGYLSIKRMVI